MDGEWRPCITGDLIDAEQKLNPPAGEACPEQAQTQDLLFLLRECHSKFFEGWPHPL